MLGAILAMAVVAAGPAGPDPASLVGELGSPRYLQREAAEAALTKLGRAALPSLRAALGARDPEVRMRASAIVSRIEGNLLVQPTAIAFDFQDVLIIEALRSISHQADLAFRLSPENDPAWPRSRLTLRTAEPLPFWKGIDALCEAGGLHYTLNTPQTTGRRESAFSLYEGYVPPTEPVSDSGPFRTLLNSVRYESEIQLSRNRPIVAPAQGRAFPAVSPARSSTAPIRQFYLQLLTAAEPRLSITQNGPPRIFEAFDDEGKSLLIPPASASLQRSSGYFGMNPSPVVRFRVDLAYPSASGRRIKRLKGAVPLIVATRKSEPLKFSLEGSTGQTFRGSDVELTIREIKLTASPNQPAVIELTLKSLAGAVSPSPADEVDPMAARLESPQQQLEVLDARGESIAWFPSSSFFNGEETRLTLTLLFQGQASKPSAIAYHGITRLSTEVPFEFRDIPIP